MAFLSDKTVKLFQNITSIIYPSFCLGCDKLIQPGRKWCNNCWTELAQITNRQYCRRCGTGLGPHQKTTHKGCDSCTGKPNRLTGVVRVGDYDGVIRDTVRKFKYNKQLHIAVTLSRMLAAQLEDQNWYNDIDVLVPAPSQLMNTLLRGFSPGKYIAQQISGLTGLAMLPAIKPAKHIERQANLSATQRRLNVNSAYKINVKMPIKGATVCLIDDVMTTGATLQECAKVLKEAGAGQIYAGVIAHSKPEEK